MTQCIISRDCVVQGADLENIKAHVLRQYDFFGGFEFSFFLQFVKPKFLSLRIRQVLGD